MSMSNYYVAMSCADCDGGLQFVEIEADEDEFQVEKRYGGNIIFRSDSSDEVENFIGQEKKYEYE